MTKTVKVPVTKIVTKTVKVPGPTRTVYVNTPPASTETAASCEAAYDQGYTAGRADGFTGTRPEVSGSAEYLGNFDAGFIDGQVGAYNKFGECS